MKNQDTAGGLAKRPSMFKLTLPLFIELLLQVMVGFMDQLMISHYDETMVGAVSNADSIINIVLILFSIVSTATTILVSQYLGAKEYDKLSEVYTLSIALNLIFGLIISLLLFILAPSLAVWMRVPESLRGGFVSYLRIVGGFLFLQSTFLSYSALFKSNGFAAYTTAFAVVMNIVNIFVNWLLIYGKLGMPELGVDGAAIATSFSKAVGLALTVICYGRTVKTPISPSGLRPFPRDMLRRILRIGLPSAGENLSYDVSQLVILVFVNMLGAADLTARSHAWLLAWVCCLFSSSVGNALRILVGYLVGAGENEEAVRVIKRSVVVSTIISVGCAALICVFSDAVFGLFTTDPEVLKIAHDVYVVEIILEFGRTVNIIMVASLQAAGDVEFPLRLGIISNWLVAVPLAYVFGIPLGMGLVGIWIGCAADECLRGAVYVLRFKKGVWRTRNLME